MKLKKLHVGFLAMAIAIGNAASAQLYIDNATFFIESGAVVTVQGDVTSNANIQGTGKLLLKGSSNQNVNMNNGGASTNAYTIPNLEVDNTSNVTLTGNARVGTSLLFTNGKIQAGNFDLYLSDVATVTGQGTGKFVETNGTGQVRKQLTANVSASEIPVGYGTNYQPAFITSTGTYSSANVGIQVKGTAHPNKNARSTDYLNLYWPITQTGITGTLRVTGKYNSNFTGTEANMRGITYASGDWNLANAFIDNAFDTAGSLISTPSADLYASNRFVKLKSKVFLQGCYNTATGLMNDNLRTLGSFPLSDPYRTAPYSTSFTHNSNNTTPVETINSSVLATQSPVDNSIVDWVFIELRNGSTVLNTRSALLQRDGDIVDLDGVSPLYFNNADILSNYTIAVRHRNHLGLSTDPAALLTSLNEKIPASTLDLTTLTDAQLFGAAGTNFAVSSNSKNMLYAGNVNGNGFVRYQGNNGPGAAGQNDRTILLSDLGNNELQVLNSYQRGDVNMNGFARYQGNNGAGSFNVSDRVFLLGTVLGNNELSVKAQALP